MLVISIEHICRYLRTVRNVKAFNYKLHKIDNQSHLLVYRELDLLYYVKLSVEVEFQRNLKSYMITIPEDLLKALVDLKTQDFNYLLILDDKNNLIFKNIIYPTEVIKNVSFLEHSDECLDISSDIDFKKIVKLSFNLRLTDAIWHLKRLILLKDAEIAFISKQLTLENIDSFYFINLYWIATAFYNSLDNIERSIILNNNITFTLYVKGNKYSNVFTIFIPILFNLNKALYEVYTEVIRLTKDVCILKKTIDDSKFRETTVLYPDDIDKNNYINIDSDLKIEKSILVSFREKVLVDYDLLQIYRYKDTLVMWTRDKFKTINLIVLNLHMLEASRQEFKIID